MSTELYWEGRRGEGQEEGEGSGWSREEWLGEKRWQAGSWDVL